MNSIIKCLDAGIDLLTKPIYAASKILHWVALVIVGIMSLPIVADVLSRIFFRKSIMGILELSEFAMVIIVFGSLAYTQINKGHIQIDILVERFSKKVQDLIDVFNYTIGFTIYAILAWQLYLQIGKKMNLLSSALGLPLYIFITIACLGTLIFAAVILLDLLKAVSKVLKERVFAWLIVTILFAISIIMLPGILQIFSIKITGLALGSLGFCLMFILMMFRLPIATGMALIGLLGMIIVSGKPSAALSMIAIAPYAATANFMMVVVPLFVLMGELAFRSGISQDLFDTAYKWLGKLPGGLAMSSVAGCAGFAAVCGDSIATAVTMGTVALPEMKEKKYDSALATGCIAAGGTLGILIPPSAGFIFYAIVAEESIGKLFMAGIVPGIMLTLLFMIYIYIATKRNPALGPPGESSTFKEKIVSLKGVIGMVFLIVLILGGILSGFFSPTEGGAVGAVGAFLFALGKRSVTLDLLVKSLKTTLNVTCMLMTILIGVAVLGYFLAATRLPFELADFVTGLNVGRYVIFLGVVILYIILGCIMNVIPIILLTLPAILPTVLSLGFDPIWFGVVTVLLMQMGQITPPIGINVFAINSVAKDVSIETIARGIIPFFVCMTIAVLLITIFPQIALFLPSIFF
ncbi:MAG: TRAP transporter large permease subunit [Dehalobacterium sp.]